MENESRGDAEAEFTDAELEMFADFSEAAQRGEKPDLEEYLKRCPGSEAKMRPILEMSLVLDHEITEFRRKFPNVDLGRLLDLKRRPKPTD